MKQTASNMRFSRKRFLAGISLFAIGIAAVVHIWPASWQELRPLNWDSVAIWLGGGAMSGAGAFFPFNHPIIGAIIGCVLQALLLAAAMAYITLIVRLFSPIA